MAAPETLASARFMSLESFKRDGSGVRTPVWFAEVEGHLVVFSAGSSFKVKRIRRDPRVRVAPCDMRGGLRGDWVEGTFVILGDPEREAQARKALRRRYGWQMWVADVGARLAGRLKTRAYLEITLAESAD